MKQKNEFIILLVLFCIGFISRAFLVEKYQSHWDGPLYSIAVIKYDLLQYTPPEPGYPLYIGLGKMVNILFNEPHAGLLFLSILFSGLGSVAIYYFGKTVFNKRVGLIAALLLLSAPTFYFFGVTTYAYIGLPTLVALFAASVYGVYVKKNNAIFFPSLFFAISLAYRPQDIFFILPLYLLYLTCLSFTNTLKSFFIILLVTLMWLIPVGQTIGGVPNYINHIRKTSSSGAFPGLQLLLGGFAFDIFVLRIFRGIYLTLGIGLIVLLINILLIGIKNQLRPFFTRKKIFFIVLMLPAFLFHVFLRIEHAGYQFTYLVPLIILVAFSIDKISFQRKKVLVFITAVVIGFNLFTFFRDRDVHYLKPYSPTSFHYSEIRKNDYKFEKKKRFITKKFNPQDTIIIVGTPEMFTPTAYHLKNYKVYQFDNLTTEDIRFVDRRRFGYNYKLFAENSKSRNFVIPIGVKYAVLLDDESIQWKVQNQSKQNFGKNTHLTYIMVNGNQEFIYGYKSFLRKDIVK